MATIQNFLPNERQLVRAYAGTEAVLGTFVTPTFRQYGDLRLTRTRPLADRNEYAGTVFGRYSKVRGAAAVDGTWAQPLSFEDLAINTRYAILGGGAGVTDGETTPAYTYERIPSPTRVDIDFQSGEYGFPGLPFRYTGLHYPEFTISGDIDNAEAVWMWNSPVMALSKTLMAKTTGTATSGTTTTIVQTSAGWTVDAFIGGYVRMLTGTAGNIGQLREIIDNTADTLTVLGAFPSAVASADTFAISGVFTPGIADRDRELIDVPGTKLYLDPVGSIGSTQVEGRFISFSTTWTRNSYRKRFMEDTEAASRYGFGRFDVTGQVRLEFDRSDEYEDWVGGVAAAIRIEQTGTDIDTGAGTTKLAQINILDAAYDAATEDDREGNVTLTLTFAGYVDTSEGHPGSIAIVLPDATLP